MAAISHAMRILNWRENLPDDEMPPEEIWMHEDELEKWFEEVSEKRNSRFGGSSSNDVEVPMMSNEELTERFRK